MSGERNTRDGNGIGARAERLTPEQEQFVKGAEYAIDMVGSAAAAYCGALCEDGLPRHNALLSERVNDVADFIIRYLARGLDGAVTDMRDRNAMEAEDRARAGEDGEETGCAAPVAGGQGAGGAEETHDARSAEDAPDRGEPYGEDLAAQIENLLKEEAELEARLMECEKTLGPIAEGSGAQAPAAEKEEPDGGETETPAMDGTDAEDGESATDAEGAP